MISKEKKELFSKELYRAIVIGPTGAGKSQFCNFIQRDLTNSKNIVSDSLDSCTKDPNSNIFQRGDSNYEFIDTAGSADTAFDDIQNLEKLINFVKKKETIDYIILLLNFSERLNKDTRQYLSTLGKIFTALEFYTHLCVIFTHFPTKPSKKIIKIKEERIKEINEILQKIFIENENDEIFKTLKKINVYFIDTEINEDDNTYDEKSQETIDIMMKHMKLDVMEFKSINTTNFDVNGESCKIRKNNEKKEIERLKKLLEESKLKQERDEEQIKKLSIDINNLKLKNDEESKRKQIDLENQYKAIQMERKKNEELYNQNRIFAQQIEEKRVMINKMAEKNGIDIGSLDEKIKEGLGTAGISGGTAAGIFATGCLLDASGYAAYFVLGSTGVGLAVAAAALCATAYFGIKKYKNS